MLHEANHKATIYTDKYGAHAINECKKMIEIALTTKAEKYWKAVLSALENK
jgi:hypothetical protein